MGDRDKKKAQCPELATASGKDSRDQGDPGARPTSCSGDRSGQGHHLEQEQGSLLVDRALNLPGMCQ